MTRDPIDEAWGLIANVSGGDWGKQANGWKEAAIRWRDENVTAQKLGRAKAHLVGFVDTRVGGPVTIGSMIIRERAAGELGSKDTHPAAFAIDVADAVGVNFLEAERELYAALKHDANLMWCQRFFPAYLIEKKLAHESKQGAPELNDEALAAKHVAPPPVTQPTTVNAPEHVTINVAAQDPDRWIEKLNEKVKRKIKSPSDTCTQCGYPPPSPDLEKHHAELMTAHSALTGALASMLGLGTLFTNDQILDRVSGLRNELQRLRQAQADIVKQQHEHLRGRGNGVRKTLRERMAWLVFGDPL